MVDTIKSFVLSTLWFSLLDEEPKQQEPTTAASSDADTAMEDDDLYGAQNLINLYLLFAFIILMIVFFNLSFENQKDKKAREKAAKDHLQHNIAIWNASQAGLRTLSNTRAAQSRQFYPCRPISHHLGALDRAPSDTALQICKRTSRTHLSVRPSSSIQNLRELHDVGRTRGFDFHSRAEAMAYLRAIRFRTFKAVPGGGFIEVCSLCHRSITDVRHSSSVVMRTGLTRLAITDAYNLTKSQRTWGRRILVIGTGCIIVYGIYRIFRSRGH